MFSGLRKCQWLYAGVLRCSGSAQPRGVRKHVDGFARQQACAGEPA